MSALYMQGLSEGNAKYERDLERYKKLANESLASYSKEEPRKAAELQKTWSELRNFINIAYSEEFGWDIDSSVRRDFRGYLSTIYQQSLAEMELDSSIIGQQQFALVQFESIVARFFDISSTYNGTLSLSVRDSKDLDPKKISQEFKIFLNTLVDNSKDESRVRELSSIKYKWEFIEESVVNYNDQSAFFLVYATKNKIKKALESGFQQLSANNY